MDDFKSLCENRPEERKSMNDTDELTETAIRRRVHSFYSSISFTSLCYCCVWY